MAAEHRRGVTKGYVWGLVFAVVTLALALLVAAWGLIALATDTGPVTTPGRPNWLAVLYVVMLLGVLVWGLWQQSLTLLRGKKTPPWRHTMLLALGGYLLWCLLGIVGGFNIADTWLSPYALTLGLIWGASSLLQWGLLARRVYTDRPAPQWPWERREEAG